MAVRSDNRLGVEGAKALVPALMKMVHMTSLNVEGALWQMWWMGVCEGACGVVTCMWCMHMAVRTGNRLGAKGAKALAPALMQMAHMTSLNVWGALWRWLGV